MYTVSQFWRKTVVSYHMYQQHVKKIAAQRIQFYFQLREGKCSDVQQIDDAGQFVGIVEMDLQPPPLAAGAPDGDPGLKTLL